MLGSAKFRLLFASDSLEDASLRLFGERRSRHYCYTGTETIAGICNGELALDGPYTF